jgi:hypothetical protein
MEKMRLRKELEGPSKLAFLAIALLAIGLLAGCSESEQALISGIAWGATVATQIGF